MGIPCETQFTVTAINGYQWLYLFINSKRVVLMGHSSLYWLCMKDLLLVHSEAQVM